MATVIGTYNYTYGAGTTHNRQIQFLRAATGAGTIQAQVFVLGTGGDVGARTSVVPGNQINVEMENTTSKVNARIMGGNLNPDSWLSALTVAQQNGIMGSISSRRIEITNGVGAPGGLYEVVQRLNIIDPT